MLAILFSSQYITVAIYLWPQFADSHCNGHCYPVICLLRIPIGARWSFNSSPHGQSGHNIVRQHFQMHFLEWKLWYSDSNLAEICSQESNWQYPSIGSGNGLAPNRWQAITWTNDDPVDCSIYAALGGNELRCTPAVVWSPFFILHQGADSI